MEITLDIGKHIYNGILEKAESEGKEIDELACELLDLGFRITQQKNDEDMEIDDKERLLIENNKMMKEVMSCVFDKRKTTVKAFDSESLVTMIENETHAYLVGKSES